MCTLPVTFLVTALDNEVGILHKDVGNPSQGGWESLTRRWESFTRRSGILHKEVGNPSQGGRESFTRRSGILHKEVGNPSQGGRESFTRRSGILHKEVGNPSQGGRESFTRRSGILHNRTVTKEGRGHRVHMHPPIRAKGLLFITMFFLVCLFYKISTQLIGIFNKEILEYENKVVVC